MREALLNGLSRTEAQGKEKGCSPPAWAATRGGMAEGVLERNGEAIDNDLVVMVSLEVQRCRSAEVMKC
jgi:hypothetical protein